MKKNIQVTVFIEDNKEIPFKVYFKMLSAEARKKLREMVRDEMLIEDTTFYKWVNDSRMPSKRRLDRLREIVKVKMPEMFKDYGHGLYSQS